MCKVLRFAKYARQAKSPNYIVCKVYTVCEICKLSILCKVTDYSKYPMKQIMHCIKLCKIHQCAKFANYTKSAAYAEDAKYTWVEYMQSMPSGLTVFKYPKYQRMQATQATI